MTLKKNSDLASIIMKEPYVFDLIELTEDYNEKQIKKEAFLINLLLPFFVNNYLVLRSLLSVALSFK